MLFSAKAGIKRVGLNDKYIKIKVKTGSAVLP